jgi:YegS/Rv2252/BmrU family lipid kinase
MLLNPKARRGELAVSQVDRLQARGISVVCEEFQSPEEMVADIERQAADFDLVIVCGGDGTIAAAAPAVLKTGLPMGILPLGTANDLARTLGIPFELDAAADVIARGRKRRIDVGTVNGVHFFNVASIGLAADVARRLTSQDKKKWGALGYAFRAAQVLLTARPFSAVIKSQRFRMRVRTLQIAVGNGRHYGGGAVIHHDARIDDGRLDLYSLDPRSVWKLALLFEAFRRGRHGAWAEVETSHCTDFWIHTRKPRPINTDGDLLTHTPAHFVVHPQAVEVFAP